MNCCWRVALVLSFLSCSAAAAEFELYFHDGHVDEYSSKNALFKRTSCEAKDHRVSFSLSRADIRTLSKLAREVDFFRLPKVINQNLSRGERPQESSVAEEQPETITICSPCFDSVLRIRVGRRVRSIRWSCKCDTHDDYGDPAELQPLMNELRRILYGAPEIAKLPKSSCLFY